MNTWDYIDLKILNKERKSDKEITKILLLLLLITRKLMFMIPIIFMFGILYYYYLVYIFVKYDYLIHFKILQSSGHRVCVCVGGCAFLFILSRLNYKFII